MVSSRAGSLRFTWEPRAISQFPLQSTDTPPFTRVYPKRAGSTNSRTNAAWVPEDMSYSTILVKGDFDFLCPWQFVPLGYSAK